MPLLGLIAGAASQLALFYKVIVAVGKRAGVSLELQGAEQPVHEHACCRANQQWSGVCSHHGQKEGLLGTEFQGLHDSTNALSL